MQETGVITQQHAQWESPKPPVASLVNNNKPTATTAELPSSRFITVSDPYREFNRRANGEKGSIDTVGTLNPRLTLESSVKLGETQRETSKIPPFGTIVDLRKSGEKRIGESYLFSKEWLMQEVARERQKPASPGEKIPWYHLAGTGFWVKDQVAQLLRNVAVPGQAVTPTLLEKELSKVKVDFLAFEKEYLQQMVSLRWNLAWGTHNGEKRLIAPDYGNALLSEVTGEKEREGVVYNTLFGDKENGKPGVEDWLRDAPNESFAIIVSPKGWSGLQDAAGNDITYPESQIYAIHKRKDGSLQTFTLRLDATIEQNEQFQRKLGLSIPESVNEKEKIKNTFMNVALITPFDADTAEKEGRLPIRSFKDITQAMQESVGGREQAFGEFTFSELNDFLDNPDRFSYEHPYAEPLIDRFIDYARWRLYKGGIISDIETELQIALSLSPIHLNKIYDDEAENGGVTSTNGESGFASDPSRVAVFLRKLDYQFEQDRLQKKGGCAGGSQSVQVSSMGMTRNGEVSGSSGDMKCVTCPFCHKLVDAIVEGGQIYCPEDSCSANKSKKSKSNLN